MNKITHSNETNQKQLFTGDYKSFDANNVNFSNCSFNSVDCHHVELTGMQFADCKICNCKWEGNEAQAVFKQCGFDHFVMKYDQPSQYRFEGSGFVRGNEINIKGYGEIQMVRCVCVQTLFSAQNFTADGVDGGAGMFITDLYDEDDLPVFPLDGYEEKCVFENCTWWGNGLPVNMRLSGCLFQKCKFYKITFNKFWAAECWFIDCEWIDCSLEREESGQNWFNEHSGMMYNNSAGWSISLSCRGQDQIFVYKPQKVK